MINKNTFQNCLKKGYLFQIGTDSEKVLEIINLTNHRIEFWNSINDKVKKYPTLFIEGYYEIIKELVTAILLLDGWNSKNHECSLIYLKKKYFDKLDLDYDFIFELKETRNNIAYRGLILKNEKWNLNKFVIFDSINQLYNYINLRLEKL